MLVTRICEKCKKSFLPTTVYEGKHVENYGRKHCFECVPYQVNKIAKYIYLPNSKNTIDGKRECRICREFKDLIEFSPTNKAGNLSSYCKPCSAKKNRTPKHRFKSECIIYKGGKCIRCGYHNCEAAMEFHHRNPKEKDFSMRDLHTTILTDKIKLELDKCDLLCSNCHKEVHYLKEWDTKEGYYYEG